jgi:hypothetical protein
MILAGSAWKSVCPDEQFVSSEEQFSALLLFFVSVHFEFLEQLCFLVVQGRLRGGFVRFLLLLFVRAHLVVVVGIGTRSGGLSLAILVVVCVLRAERNRAAQTNAQSAR